MRLKHLLVAALIAVPVGVRQRATLRMNNQRLSIEVGFGVFPPTGGFQGTGCATDSAVVGGPADPCTKGTSSIQKK